MHSNKYETQKPSTSSKNPAAAGTGSDATGARPTSSADDETLKEKVISDELRELLSRKIKVLDKKAIVEHGGGF